MEDTEDEPGKDALTLSSKCGQTTHTSSCLYDPGVCTQQCVYTYSFTHICHVLIVLTWAQFECLMMSLCGNVYILQVFLSLMSVFVDSQHIEIWLLAGRQKQKSLIKLLFHLYFKRLLMCANKMLLHTKPYFKFCLLYFILIFNCSIYLLYVFIYFEGFCCYKQFQALLRENHKSIIKVH